MNKKISILLLLIVSVIVISCDGKSNKTEKEPTKKESITEKLEKVNNVEEFKKMLDGTTWHYTEPIDNSEIGCWIKLEFKGNEYTSYYARPSDGEWTLSKKGIFDVDEKRYANTGEKFYLAICEGEIIGATGSRFTAPANIYFTNYSEFYVSSEVVNAVLGNRKNKPMYSSKAEYGDYSWD